MWGLEGHFREENQEIARFGHRRTLSRYEQIFRGQSVSNVCRCIHSGHRMIQTLIVADYKRQKHLLHLTCYPVNGRRKRRQPAAVKLVNLNSSTVSKSIVISSFQLHMLESFTSFVIRRHHSRSFFALG